MGGKGLVPRRRHPGIKAGPGSKLSEDLDCCGRPIGRAGGVVPIGPHPNLKGGPDMEEETGDFIKLPSLEEIAIFSHTNPMAKPEEITRQLKYIDENGRILKAGDISKTLTAKRAEYHENNCIAPELALAAEKLFRGGKYVFKSVMAPFFAYRIADIPNLAEIELVTLTMPTIPNFSFPEGFDLSLDILFAAIDELTASKEKFPLRTSLRIPVLKNDERIPKNKMGRFANMFVITYMGNEETTTHYHSYADRWSLEEGIENAIKRYNNAVMNLS